MFGMREVELDLRSRMICLESEMFVMCEVGVGPRLRMIYVGSWRCFCEVGVGT
jgi:hypothetical protein